MRRWRERYEEGGFSGLFDRRGGKPSPKRVPMAVVERSLLTPNRWLELSPYLDQALAIPEKNAQSGCNRFVRKTQSWVSF